MKEENINKNDCDIDFKYIVNKAFGDGQVWKTLDVLFGSGRSELDELEAKYLHWHNEFLFFKKEVNIGFFLIVITYFSYLCSAINNNISFAMIFYSLCFGICFFTLHDILKLKKAIKKRDFFDKAIKDYYIDEGVFDE